MPWRTLALVLAALIATALPAASSALIFERGAIAAGEAWRLLTGHLVHYSVPHLAADALGLLLAGGALELTRRRGVGQLYLLTALIVGGGLYLLLPDLGAYGGLSGLVCASFAFVALSLLRSEGRTRALGILLLAALAAKLLADLAGIHTTPALPGAPATVPLAHALGALAGVASFVLSELSARPAACVPAAESRA